MRGEGLALAVDPAVAEGDGEGFVVAGCWGRGGFFGEAEPDSGGGEVVCR